MNMFNKSNSIMGEYNLHTLFGSEPNGYDPYDVYDLLYEYRHRATVIDIHTEPPKEFDDYILWLEDQPRRVEYTANTIYPNYLRNSNTTSVVCYTKESPYERNVSWVYV